MASGFIHLRGAVLCSETRPLEIGLERFIGGVMKPGWMFGETSAGAGNELDLGEKDAVNPDLVAVIRSFSLDAVCAWWGNPGDGSNIPVCSIFQGWPVVHAHIDRGVLNSPHRQLSDLDRILSQIAIAHRDSFRISVCASAHEASALIRWRLQSGGAVSTLATRAVVASHQKP